MAGLPSFRGLPHRMEEVAGAGRVLWVNDSKATNPDSARKSLVSFENDLLDRRRQAQARRLSRASGRSWATCGPAI